MKCRDSIPQPYSHVSDCLPFHFYHQVAANASALRAAKREFQEMADMLRPLLLRLEEEARALSKAEAAEHRRRVLHDQMAAAQAETITR